MTLAMARVAFQVSFVRSSRPILPVGFMSDKPERSQTVFLRALFTAATVPGLGPLVLGRGMRNPKRSRSSSSLNPTIHRDTPDHEVGLSDGSRPPTCARTRD